MIRVAATEAAAMASAAIAAAAQRFHLGWRATACAGGPIVFGSDSRSRASFSSQ
jgi:hypothetical protein